MNGDGDVALGLMVLPALDLALGPHTGGLGGGLLSVHGGLGLGACTNGRFGTRPGLALRLCFAVGIASLGSSEGEAMAFLAEFEWHFSAKHKLIFLLCPSGTRE